MSPRKNPQKSPPSTLRFDFRKAAQKVGKDHPELRRHGLFIDAANDDYIGSARVFAQLEDDDEAMDDIKKLTRDAKRLKTSFHQSIPIDSDTYIRTVVFHPDKHPLFDPQDRAIDDIGTFDHETGHALHPNCNTLDGENTADAYAILRHLQRYHGQKTDIDYAAWKRAVVFMQSGIATHLTTFTIDKILIDSQTADFNSLTPKETAAVARDYARKHTPRAQRLKKLSNDFKPLAGKPLDDKTLRQLADITLKAAPTSDTFYIGHRILAPIADGTPIQMDGKTIALKGTYWEKVNAALEKKAQSLPARHPVRRSKKHLPPPG